VSLVPFERSSDVKFEIGHVLLIDIVGYSKLLINERRKEHVGQFAEIVLAASPAAKSINEQFVRLATGDGMALVSRNCSEELVNYKRETCRAPQK
jgi:hypothetical protein